GYKGDSSIVFHSSRFTLIGSSIVPQKNPIQAAPLSNINFREPLRASFTSVVGVYLYISVPELDEGSFAPRNVVFVEKFFFRRFYVSDENCVLCVFAIFVCIRIGRTNHHRIHHWNCDGSQRSRGAERKSRC